MEEAAAAAAVSNGASVDVKPVISRGPSGDDAPNGIAGSSRVRGDLPMASAGESSKEVKIYGEWNTYISYRLAWGWVSLRAVFGAAEQTAIPFLPWHGPRLNGPPPPPSSVIPSASRY